VFTTREQKNQMLPCTVKIQKKLRITFFGYRSGSSHGRFAIKKKKNLKKNESTCLTGGYVMRKNVRK